MDKPQMSGFSVIEICEAKNNRAWESPFVLVSMSFFKPEVGANSIVIYPSPPYTYDQTLQIKDFVERQATPPAIWGEKMCNILKNAATYELGVQALAHVKATKKVAKKRTKPVKSKPDNLLLPVSGKVTKIRKKNNPVAITGSTPAAPLQPNSTETQSDTTDKVLTDISNVGSSGNNTSPSQNIESEPIDPGMDHNQQFALQAMKNILFATVPSVPGTENFKDDIQVPSTADHALSAPFILNGGNGCDTTNINITLDSLHSFNASSVSDEQSTTNDLGSSGLQDKVEYIVMTKNQLVELKDMIVTGVLGSNKMSQIVGKAVEQKVNPRFDKIDSNLKEMKGILKDQSPGKKDILTFDEFQDLHSLDLPLKTYEDFLIFDNQIRANSQDIKSDLIKFIKSTTSNEGDCIDTVKALLKKFVNNEILCKYTAQRPSQDKKTKLTKPIFKKTAFCSSVFNSLMHVYTENGKTKIDSKVFFKGISKAINIAHLLVGDDDAIEDENAADPSDTDPDQDEEQS